MSSPLRTALETALAPLEKNLIALNDSCKSANQLFSEAIDRAVEAIARLGSGPLAIHRIRELEAELEEHAWKVSPAMAQAQIDQLNGKVARLSNGIREAREKLHVYTGHPVPEINLADVLDAHCILSQALGQFRKAGSTPAASAPLRIRINKCADPGAWYARRVGEILDVVRFELLTSPSQGIPEDVYWCREGGIYNALNFVRSSDATQIVE